jgi:hypothetical protein
VADRESGLERQVQSIVRVLRQRGAQERRRAREVVARRSGKVGEREPLVEATASLITSRTTSPLG